MPHTTNRGITNEVITNKSVINDMGYICTIDREAHFSSLFSKKSSLELPCKSDRNSMEDLICSSIEILSKFDENSMEENRLIS